MVPWSVPKKVALVVNPFSRRAELLMKKIIFLLEMRGIEVLPQHLAGESDLVISIGGDGTLIRALHMTEGKVPVIGVKDGTFGILVEITEDKLEKSLTRLFSGDFEVIDACSVEVSGVQERAFNEVLLAHPSRGKTVKLTICIDGVEFNRFMADGLIAATPFGSWAYSLSVGGPIIDPRMRCMVLSPLAPWQPSSDMPLNPMVLPESSIVKVRGNVPFYVAVDGEPMNNTSRELTISLSGDGFRIATLNSDHRYFYRRILDRIAGGHLTGGERGGSQARPTAADSRSAPSGVRGFKSHPPHLNQFEQ